MVAGTRIIRVTIEIFDSTNGELTDRRVYQSENIRARGVLVGTPLVNQAQIIISNVDKEIREAISSKGTPWFIRASEVERQTGKLARSRITLEVGSTTITPQIIFTGEIVRTDLTDPPDINLIMTANTEYSGKMTPISRSFGANSTLREIAQFVANQLNLRLEFMATDRSVRNFHLSSDAASFVNILNDQIGVRAYSNGIELFVLNEGQAASDTITDINIDNPEGRMIGIPHLIEQGVGVKVLANPNIRIGERIRIDSIVYPAVNGVYLPTIISFDLANRDTPFYYDIISTRMDIFT